jgi:large subunit ribosomal protein L22
METTVYLRNNSHSPRKMRLIADLVRGMDVQKAMFTLRLNEKKMYSLELEKLIKSGIASWVQKFPTESIETADLRIKMIKVDGGKMLKRIQPAPQGRAHRVRKRYNHISLTVGNNETPMMASDLENDNN